MLTGRLKRYGPAPVIKWLVQVCSVLRVEETAADADLHFTAQLLWPLPQWLEPTGPPPPALHRSRLWSGFLGCFELYCQSRQVCVTEFSVCWGDFNVQTPVCADLEQGFFSLAETDRNVKLIAKNWVKCLMMLYFREKPFYFLTTRGRSLLECPRWF